MALNPRFESWKDKRCWIVGASTGIGAALAEDLLAKGARVAVSARKKEPLEAMAAKHGGNVAVLPLDKHDALALANARSSRRAGAGRLLVLMAGDYAPMRLSWTSSRAPHGADQHQGYPNARWRP
jgi:NADP-dependent 3-hydroxy acid dehydrogenase YdfG